MNFNEFFDWVKHRPAQPHATVLLPDPTAPTDDPDAGYFQIRLSEMFLTDERRWHQEIEPATLFVADYRYGAATVRVPFFVNNGMLAGLPAGMPEARQLRARFVDTLVVGPTPYAGGDVALFVGLFQAAIDDKRQALFAVFEKLFGSFDLGSLSQYIKVADKLTGEILACLGGADISCLLAERRVISGTQAAPPAGYIAFLRSPAGAADKAGLVVRDGSLRRERVGRDELVADHDYCLVRIERMAARNDYTSMDFHLIWSQAREKMLARCTQEAQALMLECSYKIFASPDLTEDHKVKLIQFYQAKLLAVQQLMAPIAAASTRGDAVSRVRELQERAKKVNAFDADKMTRSYDEIARLTTRFSAQPIEATRVDEEALAEHLAAAGESRSSVSAEVLVKALAKGSITL